jgi:hypothetical protein
MALLAGITAIALKSAPLPVKKPGPIHPAMTADPAVG